MCDSETDAVALISLSTSIMKRVISDTCILNHIYIYCKTIILIYTHTISRHFCNGHAVSINSVELLESSCMMHVYDIQIAFVPSVNFLSLATI